MSVNNLSKSGNYNLFALIYNIKRASLNYNKNNGNQKQNRYKQFCIL